MVEDRVLRALVKATHALTIPELAKEVRASEHSVRTALIAFEHRGWVDRSVGQWRKGYWTLRGDGFVAASQKGLA